jgi:hypothetical protein
MLSPFPGAQIVRVSMNAEAATLAHLVPQLSTH